MKYTDRLICVGLLTVLATATVGLLASYCSAYAVDVWSLPRHAFPVQALNLSKATFGPIALWCGLVALVFARNVPERRWRWALVAAALSGMISALVVSPP